MNLAKSKDSHGADRWQGEVARWVTAIEVKCGMVCASVCVCVCV